MGAVTSKEIAYVPLVQADADKKKFDNVSLAHHSVRAVDLLDLTGIFVMNSSDFFKLLFEHLARYIMLPIAAVSTIFFSVFAWLEAWYAKKEDKGFLVGKAVIETIGAALVNIAVIGGLAAATFTVGPYLFAAALGLKALYQLGGSGYFAFKAYRASNAEDKKIYRSKAIDSGVGFIVGALATVGVVMVVILLQMSLFAIGAAAGILGAAYAVYKMTLNIRDRKRKREEALGENVDQVDDLTPGSKRIKREQPGQNLQSENTDTQPEVLPIPDANLAGQTALTLTAGKNHNQETEEHSGVNRKRRSTSDNATALTSKTDGNQSETIGSTHALATRKFSLVKAEAHNLAEDSPASAKPIAEQAQDQGDENRREVSRSSDSQNSLGIAHDTAEFGNETTSEYTDVEPTPEPQDADSKLVFL